MDAISRRIVARWVQAGYSGWDPPDDGPDPPDADTLWEQTVKLYPKGLQRLLQRPKTDSDYSKYKEVSSTIFSGEIELGEESGFSLTVTVTEGARPDPGGGEEWFSKEKFEYDFFQGDRHWDGVGNGDRDVPYLKKDLSAFLKQLEANDPEGYEKSGV